MTWRECDALANRRAYHSVAVLLPDGRVVTAGNQCPADTTYEVFSPPYLFAGDGSLAPRPEISNLPAQDHHGHEFEIETPSPSDRTIFVSGQSVSVRVQLGVRRFITKKTQYTNNKQQMD